MNGVCIYIYYQTIEMVYTEHLHTISSGTACGFTEPLFNLIESPQKPCQINKLSRGRKTLVCNCYTKP